MIGAYTISSQNVQIGVVIYGSSASSPISLSQYSDANSLLRAIAGLRYAGAGGRVDLGFSSAGVMLRRARQPYVVQRTIVFVDERSNANMLTYSQRLQNENIGVTVFGMGDRVDKAYADSLSTDKKGYYTNDMAALPASGNAYVKAQKAGEYLRKYYEIGMVTKKNFRKVSFCQ